MAFPHTTTWSLTPTFVTARLVGLAVRPASAFILIARFPSALSWPLYASIYSVMISIDINRVESFREPIFAVVKQENDLTTKTIMYQGLGYEVELVKDVTNNKIIQVEMYMFNKCIAGAIE